MSIERDSSSTGQEEVHSDGCTGRATDRRALLEVGFWGACPGERNVQHS